ncbi:MAG TPA: winged helix-turn-helix domain-containing protein [Candidatus Thermoplasmatota archaeon]|nr:winged helix-turn-helix domain-containing protein [Candidatus Thermoplasmatota archaeon]
MATLAASADGQVLSFEPPAQAGSILHAERVQWVLLLFHEGNAKAQLQTTGPGTYTNHTWLWHHASLARDFVSMEPNSPANSQAAEVAAGLQEDLGFHDAWGSLYVEAAEIQLNLTAARAGIDLARGHDVGQLLPGDYARSAVRPGAYAAETGTVGLSLSPLPSSSFSLRAEGLRVVEWHGARAACTNAHETCPGAGGGARLPLLLPNGDRLNTSVESYSQVLAPGSLTASGSLHLAAAGAARLDLGVSGFLRLPLADLAGLCDGCTAPAGRTVGANGTFWLRQLGSDGTTGRLQAHVEGLSVVRLDESPFEFVRQLATPAATTGALLLAALAVRWLAPLFSRVTDPNDALKLPARRALYAAIQAHPGSTASFLMRSTGQTDGGIRHNLKALERARLIARERHNGAVCFFENHGRYSRTWRRVAAERNPELRRLLEWIEGHPRQPQREIVRQAEAWGLARTATQRRLARLAEWGLLTVHAEGRERYYSAAAAEPQEARPRSGASMVPSRPGDPSASRKTGQ